MFKKTVATLSVAALTGVGALSVLPTAQAANVSDSALVQVAGNTNPCGAKVKHNPCNPCNPCAAKNPCNPCNPCAAKKKSNPCNPCNPCAAKKKSN